MVKIMMHGCNGVMGQVISKIVEETEGAVMACGVDRVDDGHNDYPVFTDINAVSYTHLTLPTTSRV